MNKFTIEIKNKYSYDMIFNNFEIKSKKKYEIEITKDGKRISRT